MHESVVKQLLNYRFAKSLDVHCIPAGEMLDRARKLRRAVDILAANHRFVLVTERFGAAYRTHVRNKIRLGAFPV